MTRSKARSVKLIAAPAIKARFARLPNLDVLANTLRAAVEKRVRKAYNATWLNTDNFSLYEYW